MLRFLLGMENTDEATLKKIRKGSTAATDREAIRLMRQHGMIALCTWVVGFEEETDRDYWRSCGNCWSMIRTRSCRFLQHRIAGLRSIWTAPIAGVIQPDQRLWDYKHQVLETKRVPPWRLFLWVKLIEARLQLRPKALWRTWFHRDPVIRHAMRWYTRMGRRVFFQEVMGFFWRERCMKRGPVLSDYWGGNTMLDEQPLSIITARNRGHPSEIDSMKARTSISTM